MNKITKIRMEMAENRLRNSAPERFLRVREIKTRFKSLYELGDYEFSNLIPRALALNVRDGHCRDMTGRKEAVNAQD